MPAFFTYILFIVGFFLLVKGADWLVEGSASLAKKLNVSNIVIGLTVVSFGTSAPELAVNILASVSDNNGIAIGNIVGSNIANVLLVLGVCAMIYPLKVQVNTVWREIPVSLLAAVVLFIVLNDHTFGWAEVDVLSRSEGIIFLLFFALFMYYTFGVAGKSPAEEVGHVKQYSPIQSTVMVIIGLAGLVLGGKWIVDGAVKIAIDLGFSQSFVGFTIVAIGTSLPELAASVVAVRKKNTDIAIGNVIGSNIFNIFWVLGCSSVISPIFYAKGDNFSLILNIICSLLLFIFLFIGRRHLLQKWQGLMFILLYFGYLAALVVLDKA